MIPHLDTTRYDHNTAVLCPDHHPGVENIKGLKATQKAYLKCNAGHVWSIAARDVYRRGTVCPYCSGRKAIPGVSDAVSLNPFLFQQWDNHHNGGSIPSDLLPGSHTVYGWVCDKGHSFTRSLRENIKLSGRCPYCSGHRAIPGVSDVATVYPRILDYWDDNLNNISIDSLLPQSNKKVTLRCPDMGHTWDVSVQVFVARDVSCPICSNKKVLSGFNDLATTHPILAGMWSNNNTITPQEVTYGSGKTAEFVCGLGHAWKATINNMPPDGSGCPICANQKVLAGYNDFASCAPQELLEQWDVENNTVAPHDIVVKSDRKIHWVCDKGHDAHRWVSSPKERSYGKGKCPVCYGRVSIGEKELYGYIVDILGDEAVTTNNRSIIAPYELDIYVPDRGIAIEYNGLYWHTESAGRDRNYHYNKWKSCKDAGIQLITIWEDEWRDNKPLVEKMIAHKLGVVGDTRIFARKTTVVQVESSVARKFCDEHHIQGSSNGSVYFGLEDREGELVAVSVWRKNKDALYLERYCTSATVVGGMGKLLKTGKTWAKNNDCYRIVTFADHQVSDGNLYEKLGFVVDKELSPDYRYLVSGQRKHKFGYRIRRFQSDPELLYREGYTETQLAQLNGLERVWDCGKTRYVMEV